MCFTNNKFKQVNWREIHNRSVCYVFRLRQRPYSSEACCMLSSRLLASVLYTVLRHSPSPPALSVGKDGCCFAERVVSCCTVTSQALWVGWAQEDFRLEEPHLGFIPWQAKRAFCTTVWCGTCCISSVDLNHNINFWNGLISKNEPNRQSFQAHSVSSSSL